MNRFNVFVDNDLPPVFTRVLRALLSTQVPEPRVVALREVLPPDTKDVDWIEWVWGQEGDWIILTSELRIRTVPAKREALPDRSMTTMSIIRAPATLCCRGAITASPKA